MTYSVTVSVEGIRGNYCLTDSDLRVVFGRFGDVLQVLPIGDGRSATITYVMHADAQRAINELDGKALSGVSSAKLRVCWNMPVPPAALPGAFPCAAPGAFPGGPGGGSPMQPLHPQHQLQQHQLQQPHSSHTSSGASMSREFSPGMRKYTCRFEIPIENDKDFQIARRVIGKSGANMKRIVATTDAKLRLRGRGSGYLEGYNRTESPEPLHLCVSAPTKEGYEEAVRKVTELLESIFREYQEYCVSKAWAVPDLKVVIRENPLSGQPILHSSSSFNIANANAGASAGAGLSGGSNTLASLAHPVKSPLLQPRPAPLFLFPNSAGHSQAQAPAPAPAQPASPYWGGV